MTPVTPEPIPTTGGPMPDLIRDLLQHPEVQAARQRIGDVVRRNHQYGCPPDPRLQDDVDGDAEEAMGAFDDGIAAVLSALTPPREEPPKEKLCPCDGNLCDGYGDAGYESNGPAGWVSIPCEAAVPRPVSGELDFDDLDDAASDRELAMHDLSPPADKRKADKAYRDAKAALNAQHRTALAQKDAEIATLQARVEALEGRVVACTDWCADKSEAVTLWDRRHETTSAAHPETTSGVLRCTCGHTEAEHYLCGSPQGSRCLTGCGCRQYTWNKQRKDA